MIQFNLLPDVKIAYVKAMRVKRMVIGTALIVTSVTFVIFLLLAAIAFGIQKQTINNLSKDIAAKSKTLTQKKDLDKVLTIQNQLGALPALHDGKVVPSRALTFLQQLTPSGVSISDYIVDFTANTISITGTTSALDRVNLYIDTIKFAKYTDGQTTSTNKPFTSVVLSQFSKSETTTTYTITANYAADLFNNEADYRLVIPRGPTTNSVTEQPAADLFKKQGN